MPKKPKPSDLELHAISENAGKGVVLPNHGGQDVLDDPSQDIDLVQEGVSNLNIQPFEKIKKVNKFREDYWSSRDMAKVIGYKNYRNFEQVMENAMIACNTSGFNHLDHFVESDQMITIGKGAKRNIPYIALSRYACYLVIQNADPSKEIVAIGQSYFAMQTRKQEESDQFVEDVRRVQNRQEIRKHNAKLAEAAMGAGIIKEKDYAIFQNHGYRGLYGGLSARGIHTKKGLKKDQEILDHMGSTELAANLFRATQAEEKIKREQIHGKAQANKAHHEVGTVVREAIRKLGGTMPEDQPSVGSIKPLERKILGGEQPLRLTYEDDTVRSEDEHDDENG